MRQFKFRAWNKVKKQMLTFDFYALLHNEYTRDFLKSSDVIKMQYIGKDCKDSEGIELCEGDIIEDEDCEKYVINYDTEFGCFYPDGYEYESPFDYSECRIIGNIYQNPDLIGK